MLLVAAAYNNNNDNDNDNNNNDNNDNNDNNNILYLLDDLPLYHHSPRTAPTTRSFACNARLQHRE
jgi:hypothetical protein